MTEKIVTNLDYGRLELRIALFDRPYQGKDAITGLTMDEFIDAVKDVDAPVWAKKAAISICRSYDIKGVCDPGYIANIIKDSFNSFRIY